MFDGANKSTEESVMEMLIWLIKDIAEPITEDFLIRLVDNARIINNECNYGKFSDNAIIKLQEELLHLVIEKAQKRLLNLKITKK
jgi:hypothetical protein